MLIVWIFESCVVGFPSPKDAIAKVRPARTVREP